MSYDMSPAVDVEMDQHQEGIYKSFVERGRCVCRFLAVQLAFSWSTDSMGGWDKCFLSTNGLLMIPRAFYIRKISRQKFISSQKPVKHITTVGSWLCNSVYRTRFVYYHHELHCLKDKSCGSVSQKEKKKFPRLSRWALPSS